MFLILLLFLIPVIDAPALNKIVPPHKSPFKRLYGWKALGEKVSELHRRLPAGQVFIFSTNYHVASELAFYTAGNPQTYCINLGRRMNQFDMWAGVEQFEGKGYYGIYVDFSPMPDRVKAGFRQVVSQEAFVMEHQGNPAFELNVYVLANFKHIDQERLDSY